MIQGSLADNPYSAEVIGESYLFDMYEADNGGVVSDDLFADESEYTYYQKYDLIGKNNKPMDSEWEIKLAKMKKRQKEVIANSREISYMEPGGYAGNVRTAGVFEWGNILTGVDLSGNTLNSCVEMPANFNKATGKRYEISDLFDTDDYREALVKIAADRYADGITWGQSWSKALEHGYPLTFAITCKGLLLGEGYKERLMKEKIKILKDRMNIWNRTEKFVLCNVLLCAALCGTALCACGSDANTDTDTEKGDPDSYTYAAQERQHSDAVEERPDAEKYLTYIEEANSGFFTEMNGPWFVDDSDRFTYCAQDDPLYDDRRSTAWRIRLAERKGHAGAGGQPLS